MYNNTYVQIPCSTNEEFDYISAVSTKYGYTLTLI